MPSKFLWHSTSRRILSQVVGERKMRVIAKAYGDRPLDRVVVGNAERVFYIAAAAALCSVEGAQESGVGFPKACVFDFDSQLYESLLSAWNDDDRVRLAGLWTQAHPFEIEKEIA